MIVINLILQKKQQVIRFTFFKRELGDDILNKEMIFLDQQHLRILAVRIK